MTPTDIATYFILSFNICILYYPPSLVTGGYSSISKRMPTSEGPPYISLLEVKDNASMYLQKGRSLVFPVCGKNGR